MNLNLPAAGLLPIQLFISWIVLGVVVSVSAVLLSRYAYNSNRNSLGFISAAMLIIYFVGTLLGFSHLMNERDDKTLAAVASLQQQVATRYGLSISDVQARHLVSGETTQVVGKGELELYKTGGIYELVHAEGKTELSVR
jgi:cation transport ATPase